MSDMTLVEKLRSQIGDDVQNIFDHEALFRLSADRIEALEAEVARYRSDRAYIVGCNDGWDAAMSTRLAGDAPEKVILKFMEQLLSDYDETKALALEEDSSDPKSIEAENG